MMATRSVTSPSNTASQANPEESPLRVLDVASGAQAVDAIAADGAAGWRIPPASQPR
jgi:hypothetical protein